MITTDLLLGEPLFAEIAREKLDRLANVAADIRVKDGEYIVHEGEIPAFYYILEGRLAITKRISGTERTIAERTKSEYFGELPLMIGSSTFANARAIGSTRVLRFDDVAFHHLMADSPTLARAVATTLAERIGDLKRVACQTPAAIATIIGQRSEDACHQIRDFLFRNQITFDWLEPTDPLVAQVLPNTELPPAQCPIVKLLDDRVLVQPTLRELACAVGLRVDPQQSDYDLVVIGGGPAGLAAAVYGASEGLSTLMIEVEAPGGQAGTSSRIENYLGFPSGLSGDDLGARAFAQATRLGAEIIVTRSVTALEPGDDFHLVRLDGDEDLRARSLVIATGVCWRIFTAEGVDALTGRGIYYGAARSEAPSVQGRDVHIIGGGNSAGQAAVFFSNYASSVTILVRGPGLADTMSAYLIDQLHQKENVFIETRSEIVKVLGGDTLRSIVVKNADGETERESAGVFIFIGATAETSWLPPEIARDDRGYILTGADLSSEFAKRYPGNRDPYLLETSVPSIFAAGDVRHGSVKRVAAAVGEGSMAVSFVHQALAAAAKEPALAT